MVLLRLWVQKNSRKGRVKNGTKILTRRFDGFRRPKKLIQIERLSADGSVACFRSNIAASFRILSVALDVRILISILQASYLFASVLMGSCHCNQKPLRDDFMKD